MNGAAVAADEGEAVSTAESLRADALSASTDSSKVHDSAYAGLLALLLRLDSRLRAAIEVSDRMFAARAAGDLYRGLAISPADVTAALDRVPGEPFPTSAADLQEIARATDSLSLRRLLWLQGVYGLTDFDLEVILVGLAPEIDLRYERLYAYLHDDVTRRCPSIDLTLNLLCASAAEKLKRRERFAADAPLLRYRLIDVFAEPHHPNPPLLGRCFRVDEQIMRLLLLDDSLDSRLAAYCEMTVPLSSGRAAPLTEAMQLRLSALALAHAQAPLRLYFQGPAHCGQAEAAGLLAEALEVRLLKADLRSAAVTAAAALGELLPALVREAWLRGALLYVRGIELATESAPRSAFSVLWRTLGELPVHIVIEGKGVWIPTPEHPFGVTTVMFGYPEASERQQWWQQCLRRHGLETLAQTVATLAQRYRMSYSQIEDAAAAGAASSKVLPCITVGDGGTQETQPLFIAARAQCGHDLAALAMKIEPRATWNDLVLPADETAQLHEICDRFNYRDKVLNEWGFARKLSYGLGVTALFTGGSGTGKTMAAEVIANALSLDLYQVNLAQVVSKYIGETEKNIAMVFTAAANANAILFFDEADALFGKRSEVKDSHDRYANLEISYLLQKMEQYEGIAILATNLSDHLDQAFARRLAFSVHFPFPDEAARLQLWARAWPQGLPVSASVVGCNLARELTIAGGNIKNIALGAAFSSAANGEVVEMANVDAAIRREYQKLGRSSPLARASAKQESTIPYAPKSG